MINSVSQANTFVEMKNWQTQHEDLAAQVTNMSSEAYVDLLQGNINENVFYSYVGQLMDAYNVQAGQVGYEFDFMNGKNEEDYDKVLQDMAKSDLSTKDMDKSNNITFEEYLFAKIAGATLTEEEFKEAELNAKLIFDKIDGLLGKADGTWDLADMQNFYKLLDSYNVVEGTEVDGEAFAITQNDGVLDGKIHMNSSTGLYNDILTEYLSSGDKI